MAITFTPTTVNEHDNGALMGTFENSNNPTANYDFVGEKPDIFKIVGNELFLEDTWHYDFETQIFYNYTNSVTLAYPTASLTQWAFKDSEDDTQWTYADISVYEDIAELNVTPLDFASLEAGATVATISTGSSADTFLLTDNPFVTISGSDIKLVDNMYYDLGTTNFHSGSFFWDPSTSTGQISISGVQNEKINEKTLFDYPTFLQSVVSGAQQSSSLTFTPTSANEHENGALLGSFQNSANIGGIYSFQSTKPEMLKIVGDQLFLEDSYHFDCETSNFYRYTEDSEGVSWVYIPYEPDELTWRVKYTSDSGAEQFLDATVTFLDISESITVTPVAFNSLELGATVATISTTLPVNDGFKIGQNDFLTLDGNNIKLTDSFYFNNETGDLHSGAAYYDLATTHGQFSLLSTQTDIETINYYEGLDYPTFLQSAMSLAEDTPLTYYATRGAETKEKVGLNLIDSLLFDDVQVHTSDRYYESLLTDLPQDVTVITYSFSALNGTTPQYSDGYEESSSTITAFNTGQRDAARLALSEWEEVANLKFHEVEEVGDLAGTIRFAFTDLSSTETDGFWGWARSPGETASSGDIWISSENVSETNWQPGSSYNFMSLMHEIGHSLGLAHPFAEVDSGSSDTLPTSEDFRNYTLMSYTNPAESYFTNLNASENQYQYLISSSPMVYDIAAIQHLYGAAENNVGNTTFSYSPDQPFVEAIWDSSGSDTLDLSNFLESCTVSLVPGAYSTIACNGWSMVDNFGIARGTIIENANGGAGNDIIIGNSDNNILDGGNGNDILTGGLGSDGFRFSAIFGSDTITDFSLTEDTLMFFDESGVEIVSSSLNETNNDSGDIVLSAVNGSSVTLQGISAYGSSVAVLNGAVASRSGVVLEDVAIKGFDGDGNEVGSSASDAVGNFSFNTTENVTLTIQKDFTNDTEITIRDALDALKLSIGMTKSDGTINPLDFIAADMNQDGKVSVRDALEILKYSLGIDSSPAHWKFVPSDLDTSSLSLSAVTYDDTLLVNLSELQSIQNFVGILVGDVNGTFFG